MLRKRQETGTSDRNEVYICFSSKRCALYNTLCCPSWFLIRLLLSCRMSMSEGRRCRERCNLSLPCPKKFCPWGLALAVVGVVS